LKRSRADRIEGYPEALRKRNMKDSPQIEEIILHAMERDSGKRHQTAAAMKSELDDPSVVEGPTAAPVLPSLKRMNGHEKPEASH
jgi:hypothetical protein